MRKRRSVLAAILLSAMALTTACSGGGGTTETNGGGTVQAEAGSEAGNKGEETVVQIGQTSEVANLNPTIQPRTPDSNVQCMIFDYLVIPDEMEDSRDVIQAATIANRVLGCVNAPSLMQRVIKRCVDAEVDVAAYDRNRNLLYNSLKDYGFDCIKPEGAFYLFVKSPVENEKEFCETAKQYNVLVVPGSSFACPGYVRIAYCVSYDKIERSLPAFKKIAEHYHLI